MLSGYTVWVREPSGRLALDCTGLSRVAALARFTELRRGVAPYPSESPWLVVTDPEHMVVQAEYPDKHAALVDVLRKGRHGS